MVAGFQRREHGRGHRGHAGRGGPRRLGAFQLDHAALEHRNVGIGKARIEISGLLALETRFALLGAVVDEALGEKQGLGGFAEFGTDGAGMDQSGLGTVMGG